MEFRDLLKRRRVVRSYTPEPVDEAALRRVVATVQRAPSAGYSQGQRLLVVSDESMRRDISELARRDTRLASSAAHRKPWMADAPAFVVVTTSESVYRSRYHEPDKTRPGVPDVEWDVPYWYVDAGAVVMLLLLAAVDEGLAAGVFGVAGRVPELAALLRLPVGVEPVAIVCIGHEAPNELHALRRRRLSARRKSLAELVFWEAWGNPDPDAHRAERLGDD